MEDTSQPRLTQERMATALALFRRRDLSDDLQLFTALVAKGFGRRLAARLVEFVPMVYCRVLLSRSGVTFSDWYYRGTLTSTSLQLSSDPVWRVISDFAGCELEQGIRSEELLLVAGQSADFQAVNEMLKSGSKLEHITLTPPLLPWPEDGPQVEPISVQ